MAEKKESLTALTPQRLIMILEDALESLGEYKYIIVYPGGVKSICKERPPDGNGGSVYEIREYFRLLREAHKIPDNVVVGTLIFSPATPAKNDEANARIWAKFNHFM